MFIQKVKPKKITGNACMVKRSHSDNSNNIIQEKAKVKKRPLDSKAIGWAANHHHIWFDDEKKLNERVNNAGADNVGFHNGGLFDDSALKEKYNGDVKTMDNEEKAVQAINNTEIGKYNVLKNNCQHWAARVYKEYENL